MPTKAQIRISIEALIAELNAELRLFEGYLRLEEWDIIARKWNQINIFKQRLVDLVGEYLGLGAEFGKFFYPLEEMDSFIDDGDKAIKRKQKKHLQGLIDSLIDAKDKKFKPLLEN